MGANVVEGIISSKELWDHKKFVRYKDGCVLYSLSLNQFKKLAEEANAVYRWGPKLVLVNTELVDEYLEFFHITEEC